MVTQVIIKAPLNGKAQPSTSPGTGHTSSSLIRASSKCATPKPGGCVRSSPETTWDASGMGAGGQRHRSRQVPMGRGRNRRPKKCACMALCAQTTWRRVAGDRRVPVAASCSTSLSSFPHSRTSSPKNPRRPHNTRHSCTQLSTAHHEQLSIRKSDDPLTVNLM
jgi:hypothetical protein